MNWKKEIRQIATYYSELGEGTCGYSLSEEQFEKIFKVIQTLLEKQEKEMIREKEPAVKGYLSEGDVCPFCKGTGRNGKSKNLC